MGGARKTLEQVLRGTSDANLVFADVCHLLDALGFLSRVKGDHHIYFKNGVDEIINLQPRNGRAKAYQVAQVRSLILKYRLGERM